MRRLSIRRFPEVEKARKHYLTLLDEQVASPPAGVTAVREAKWQEVQQGGGPLLEAEAAAMGETLEQTIARVAQARLSALEAQAVVEAERVQKKAAVRAARTPGEMHRIVFGDQIVDEPEDQPMPPARFEHQIIE